MSITALCAVFLAAATSGGGNSFEPPEGPSVEIQKSLGTALSSANTNATESDKNDALKQACEEALGMIAPQSPVAMKLVAVVEGDSFESNQALVEEVLEMLQFQPRKEADLPAGFPTYTPVGLIEVKEYPAYRMAVSKRFMTLFWHITNRKIAMTAPVEMTFDESDDGQLREESMAFLYGDPSLGETGDLGKVNVMDVEPRTVVSIGLQGSSNRTAISEAQQALESWLEMNSEYERDGPFRMMGYNSPAIRGMKRYFEVQLPIRQKDSNSESLSVTN